nr:SEC-C metal-binding domain-containing protein [Bradyrhizobium cytisi]
MLDNPDAPPFRAENDLTLFDDTILELSTWAAFNREPPARKPAPVSFYHPERNPFRHVGRNDPCPCGSGKRFKKCCLNASPAG